MDYSKLKNTTNTQTLKSKLTFVFFLACMGLFFSSCGGVEEGKEEETKSVKCLCVTGGDLKINIPPTSKEEAKKACDKVSGQIQSCE